MFEEEPCGLIEAPRRIAAAAAQGFVPQQFPHLSWRNARGDGSVRERFQMRRDALDQGMAKLPERTGMKIEWGVTF